MQRLARARGEPRFFCPKCGLALRVAGDRLVCSCGYSRLTLRGKVKAETKLVSALEALLAEQRGNAVTVSLRKVAQMGGLGAAEIRYLLTRWRALLPPAVKANGRLWRRTGEGDKRVFYEAEGVEA